MNAYVREAGSGPGVLCFHSNAATGAQWRPLMERLSDRFRVIAVDAYGAGRSPDWPPGTPGSLSDEIALLQPLLDSVPGPLHLVGHSYGAAIAMKLALEQPGRVASVAVYEPTLFSLLIAEDLGHPAARGIREAAADAAAAIERGQPDAAAERFIDYWMGPGAWRSMPESRQAPIAHAMRGISHWGHALFGEPTPLSAFETLDVPVLYMVGERSPASSRGVYGLLARALPRATIVEFPRLGHMAPVTHPDVINAAIEQHLSGAAFPA